MQPLSPDRDNPQSYRVRVLRPHLNELRLATDNKLSEAWRILAWPWAVPPTKADLNLANPGAADVVWDLGLDRAEPLNYDLLSQFADLLIFGVLYEPLLTDTGAVKPEDLYKYPPFETERVAAHLTGYDLLLRKLLMVVNSALAQEALLSGDLLSEWLVAHLSEPRVQNLLGQNGTLAKNVGLRALANVIGADATKIRFTVLAIRTDDKALVAAALYDLGLPGSISVVEVDQRRGNVSRFDLELWSGGPRIPIPLSPSPDSLVAERTPLYGA